MQFLAILFRCNKQIYEKQGNLRRVKTFVERKLNQMISNDLFFHMRT